MADAVREFVLIHRNTIHVSLSTATAPQSHHCARTLTAAAAAAAETTQVCETADGRAERSECQSLSRSVPVTDHLWRSRAGPTLKPTSITSPDPLAASQTLIAGRSPSQCPRPTMSVRASEPANWPASDVSPWTTCSRPSVLYPSKPADFKDFSRMPSCSMTF